MPTIKVYNPQTGQYEDQEIGDTINNGPQGAQQVQDSFNNQPSTYQKLLALLNGGK